MLLRLPTNEKNIENADAIILLVKDYFFALKTLLKLK